MDSMGVRKRDGRVVEFDIDKVENSIRKAAYKAAGYDDDEDFEDYDSDESARLAYMVAGILDGMDHSNLTDDNDAESDTEDTDDTEYDDIVDVVDIQDIIERVLILEEHVKTATEYIKYRSNRDKIRDMDNELMRSYEDITFGKAADVEIKRENANIDGDSAMGTMLRYGSEGAKKFYLTHLIPEDAADAHTGGDIHIHDLDFYALTETCITGDTGIYVADGTDKSLYTVTREVKDKVVTGGSCPVEQLFGGLLEKYDVDTVVDIRDKNIFIASTPKFGAEPTATPILNVVRHRSTGKKVLRISWRDGYIDVTDNHRVTIKRDGSGTSEDIYARDIKVGDQVVCISSIRLLSNGEMLSECTIKDSADNGKRNCVLGIEEIEYSGYVYDMETGDHHFIANDILVHNCDQIDLEKLFTGGFNTGHGSIREPGEIRSYAALACIAIQSNQNDMHKRVA